MRKYFILIAFVLTSVFSACNKPAEKAPEATKNQDTLAKNVVNSTEQVVAKQEVKTYDDKRSFEVARSTKPTVAPAKLIQVCPMQIQGFTKGTNSLSTSDRDGGTVSIAGTFYKSAAGESINVLITDFGPKCQISSLEAYGTPTQETGWEMKTISGADFRGFAANSTSEKRQKLSVLLENRFVVEIEAIGIGIKDNDVRNYLKQIKTDKLTQLVK